MRIFASIMKFDIIYQDEAIVIVNKPPDFLTVPDRFAHKLPNLYNTLQAKFGEIFIVHRIDKETSGIICFARTAESHKELCRQFEKRETDKIYWTLVQGILQEKEGVIDGKLAKNEFRPGSMIVAKKGKPSVTEYKVLEEFEKYSLVEAHIKTGRQHQIRVHFRHIGHPPALDPIYNNKSEFFLSEIKRKYTQAGRGKEERPLMSRTTLHAHTLRLTHPVTKERMSFQADLPKDFRAVLTQLRKWG